MASFFAFGPRMKKVIGVLRRGGIGVLPTDTIYGVVGSAFSRKAVERLYRLRRRNSKKPMIVLIGALTDLAVFGITPNTKIKKILSTVWPGPVSVVLPCPSQKFSYLHRGVKTLAVRLPRPRSLRTLLKLTGPLVAPSANPYGLRPAETIEEAKKYFGKRVDFYVAAGRITKNPSRLIVFKRGKLKRLR